MKNLSYLAIPYSHPDKDIRDFRFHTANIVAAKLMCNGKLIYSPISHTHPISRAGKLPTDWNYWETHNRLFLHPAKELIVITLPGWQESKGVSAEISIATELNIPIKYFNFPVDLNKCSG